jgi:hypothetical protein
MNVLVQQSTAALGDEEVRAAARFKISIAPFGVAAESRTGRWMQGNEARLAELRCRDRTCDPSRLKGRVPPPELVELRRHQRVVSRICESHAS